MNVMKRTEEIKIGTDFSGIGSPEAALKRVKIPHTNIFACEKDKFARKSYESLHTTNNFYEDITKRNHAEVPQLDLYIAGFPCQAFSLSGKRLGFQDVRGTLFFDTASFIQINQPYCFVLENVKGLLSHDNGKTFQTIVDLLSNGGGTVNGQMQLDVFEDGLGYHIYHAVLNTKDYGIPQNRERIFIVGFKEYKEFTFPKPIPLQLKLKDLLQSEVDEKYYLSDKMLTHLSTHDRSKKFADDKTDIFDTITANYAKQSSDLQYLSEFKPIDINGVAKTLRTSGRGSKSNKHNFDIIEVENELIGYSRDEKGKVTSRHKKNIANTIHTSSGTGNNTDQFILQVATNTKKGYETATENDSINFSNPNSKTRRGRVGKEVSQTIETQNNIGVISNKKIRRLTPLECWRLQGFTDEEFYKAQEVNSDTQIYKQAGNSITVNVMEAVLKKVLNV